MNAYNQNRAIRVATICHNEDCATKRGHRRVRLELVRSECGYAWESDGSELNIGGESVEEACYELLSAYSDPLWGLQAKWAR